MMKRFALALTLAVTAGGCGGKDDPGPTGKASFDVVPASLAFGGVTLGTTAEQTFEVVNDGTAPVSVELTVDESVFDVEPKTAEIAKGSPQGLAASKALTTASILNAFDERAEALTRQSAELFVSDEAREGMLSFLEKRPPTWVI